jgi:capsular exopolysaccharide synthesis family protein
VCSEQFRSLAAALHQKQRDTGLKMLMVTSAHAGEGKTFTAANLAFMLSDSYARRVLLIDADLRRPSLHSAFGARNDSGLTDALRGAPGSVIRVIEVTPSLALMPAGTPVIDPMPLLTSGQVQTIFRDAAAKFDWVIIDAPPVALLPDAALFASMVESVVLVVAAGVAPYRVVNRAVEALGRQKIAGVVLNRIERSGSPDGSYDHYYGGRSPESPRRGTFFRLTK